LGRLRLGGNAGLWRLPLPRRRDLLATRRSARLKSPVILLRDGVMGAVTVVLFLQYLLLPNARIAVA
jgi:hypothetical protein